MVLEKEYLYDSDPTESNKLQLCQARSELEYRLRIEELYWSQKANLK